VCDDGKTAVYVVKEAVPFEEVGGEEKAGIVGTSIRSDQGTRDDQGNGEIAQWWFVTT
jgi:hypothetical protein